MGGYKKFKKSEPLFAFTKSFILCCFVVLTACSHKSITSQIAVPIKTENGKPKEVPDLGLQLTSWGDNFSPRLSPSENTLVYVSRQRPSHQQEQIYEIDVNNGKEKRLVFQYGQCLAPVYLDENEIIFSSSNDEIKESPALFLNKTETSPYPRTEIYILDKKEDLSRRLTHKPGFDGKPEVIDHKTKLFYYLSENKDKKLEIFRSGQKIFGKDNISIDDVDYSSLQKKWIWVENKKSIWASEQLFKNPQELNLPKGEYQQARWLPVQNKILISAKMEGAKFSQIYLYDIASKCLSPLTKNDTNLSEATSNLNETKMLFVAEIEGQRQVFIKAISFENNECLKSDEQKTN